MLGLTEDEEVTFAASTSLDITGALEAYQNSDNDSQQQQQQKHSHSPSKFTEMNQVDLVTSKKPQKQRLHFAEERVLALR